MQVGVRLSWERHIHFNVLVPLQLTPFQSLLQISNRNRSPKTILCSPDNEHYNLPFYLRHSFALKTPCLAKLVG